jgi:copper chaperone CopZ
MMRFAANREAHAVMGRRLPPAGQGDCVDCTLCVQACPTGIDIRQGLQYDCIACAACIDACDAVMEKVGSPKGLVRYSTQAEMDGSKARILRPRTLIYSLLLGTLMCGFAFAVSHRNPVDLDVLRDRNTLYRELDNGAIENVFTVRIINKDQHAHTFRLTATHLQDAVVDSDTPTQLVSAEDVRSVVIRVRTPAAQGHGGQTFDIDAQSVDNPGHRSRKPRAIFFPPLTRERVYENHSNRQALVSLSHHVAGDCSARRLADCRRDHVRVDPEASRPRHTGPACRGSGVARQYRQFRGSPRGMRVLEATGRCFHCGEPLARRGAGPASSSGSLNANVRGEQVAVCCHGCRAAVQFVESMGLDDFYRFRTESSPKPRDSTTEWMAYDAPELLEAFTSVDRAGRRILLMIEGMNCAACSWLINRSVEKIEGVQRVSVNTATGRAEIAWDDTRVALSRLMEVIAGLGYTPQIITPDATDARIRDERRALLKRLAVAGLGMMQVMMFAIAMYAADLQGGMDADVRSYLRLVSMLVATPVMLYGGWPFFVGAVRALSIRAITMDVPVTLGLALAYGASVYDTSRHVGDVYFDSVTMFIFFLTVARYVEMVARHQSTRVSDSLARMLPATAHRLTPDGVGQEVTEVSAAKLLPKDRLLVRVGEVVPADGQIVRGNSQFDESMLTGEALPVERTVGSAIVAGTLNLGAPVEMQVTAAGRSTVLAGIVSLLNRAQSERPRLTRAGDRFASRFLARVIVGAALVCLFGASSTPVAPSPPRSRCWWWPVPAPFHCLRSSPWPVRMPPWRAAACWSPVRTPSRVLPA